MSKWKEHKAKWSDCDLCELCETRRRVVLFKGKIPCDVLLIGEAPGQSEDKIGKPFIGPAGHLLDQIVAESGINQFRLGYTNLTACIPLDVDGNKVHDPDKEHILACADRLVEIVKICKPRAIVAVGKLSYKYLPKVLGAKIQDSVLSTTITHPGAILRADITQKGLQVQQATIRLRDLAEELE